MVETQYYYNRSFIDLDKLILVWSSNIIWFSMNSYISFISEPNMYYVLLSLNVMCLIIAAFPTPFGQLQPDLAHPTLAANIAPTVQKEGLFHY